MAATKIRVLTLLAILAVWELVARSGLLYQNVVPSLTKIVAAFFRMLAERETWTHFAITAWEVGAGLTIGYVIGGFRAPFRHAPVLRRRSRPLRRRRRHRAADRVPADRDAAGRHRHRLQARPRCALLFPVAINTAASVRQVNPVLVRVGRSFRLSRWQMATRIYLPALRPSLVTSLRLGFGLAVVGVLLAEIKLSNAGLGFLANEHYSHFRVPDLYAVLVLIFLVAVRLNSLMGRFAERQ